MDECKNLPGDSGCMRIWREKRTCIGPLSSIEGTGLEVAKNLFGKIWYSMKDGAQFLFTPINKSASEIKEIILDIHLPRQKNRRVIFQCGDRAQLTSEHVVLLTASLPPEIRPKIRRKNCMENVRGRYGLKEVKSLVCQNFKRFFLTF
ncbi:UNVERIFIED_CONTAM: hypothetical protein NCL1_40735 [Trichonephila clavipes]